MSDDVRDTRRRFDPARRLARSLSALLGVAVVTAAAIAFSLRVTPTQSVSALGQTVEVGTASPTLSLSGPGVLDLFGQSLDTKARFTGPVRPRIVLTRITINEQVASFLAPAQGGHPTAALGKALADGWKRYFVWEVVFVALGALVLTTAYLGIRRRSLGRSLASLLAVLAVAEGVNLGWIMLTAYSAPRILQQVHSLSELVGRSLQAPLPAAAGPARHGIQAVVLGDSTAAGLGNPLVPHPSRLDRACHRSADAYAVDLASVNGWNVENLACSGATIETGILGPQQLGGGLVAAPQLAEAKRAVDAKALFLSVGANDLDWDALVRLCAVSTTCNDAASTAFFQSRLHHFATDYYALLEQLASLPGHPKVVVNQYYDPFDPKLTCLDHVGLTGAKQQVLVQRLDALNAVLARGAAASGFATVQPDFSGHALCSADPYVQGLADPAPFHPTASGQLAIALADERALQAGG